MGDYFLSLCFTGDKMKCSECDKRKTEKRRMYNGIGEALITVDTCDGVVLNDLSKPPSFCSKNISNEEYESINFFDLADSI
mgnify:CR=1 FL=1|jgi:hypothetical protein